jgi:P2 family phage major capsid protein
MRNDTRRRFNELRDRIAHLSGVPNASEQFNVEPSVQQTLETRIQESSEFLTRINVVGVDEQKGQKVGISVSPIAGRTNVDQNDRAPRSVEELSDNAYECLSTEFDTAISWARLDAWAKFPDFQTRVRNAIIRQQALDRIMIGFNGTSAANETDRTANPMLQDVNKGWLQKYRDHAAARVVDGVVIDPAGGGDFRNLDAMVMDAVNNLVDPWHQESTDLVAIVGRQILHDKYFPLVEEHGTTPTEARAADLVISQKRMGGLQAVRAPYVPDGTVFITSLENLSLYWQTGSRRRYVIDNPKRNRIENYESSNDAYVIEDYGFGCLIEGITWAAPAE